ncbi:MAG TPA: transglycosylase SLT domain-containing protein, partial [Pseudonocardiaceae bacterium]|nr:transglycosylase SLT domain-containing protein [Pseudonocardiaceae bacterium]
HPDIAVRVDADKALAELAAVDEAAKKVNGKTIKANVDDSEVKKLGSSADETGNKLTGMGNQGRTGLAPLIALAVASSGALLGAIPAAIGLGAALVGVGFSFGGISAALKGYSADQAAAATASSQSAATQLSNAIAIRNAEQSIADAKKNQARVAEDAAASITAAEQRVTDAENQKVRAYQSAADSVTAAEERVTSAQQAEQAAQEALTNAREAATRQLETLNQQVADMALNEEGASLAVEQAQERLKKLLAGGADPTSLAARQAQYDVEAAQQRLKDLQANDARTRQDAAEANAQGVEGADAVVKAKQGVVTASKNVSDAQKAEAKAVADAAVQRAAADKAVTDAKTALGKAEETAGRQQADAAEAVAKAVQSLSDTQAQQAASAASAAVKTSQFATAMAKLTPEGRAFVNQLLAMEPLVKKLRDTSQSAFLPGLTSMLRDSQGLFPIFNRYVKESGTILGDAARQEGELFKSQAFKDNLSAMLTATEPVTRSLGGMLVTLSGRLVRFGAEMTPASKGFADFLDGVTRGLSGFFDGLAPHAESFKRIWDALGLIFQDLLPILGQIIGEFSDVLAPTLEKVAGWIDRNKEATKLLIEGFTALYLLMKGAGVVSSVAGWVQGVTGWLDKVGARSEANAAKVDALKASLKGVGIVAGLALLAVAADAVLPQNTPQQNDAAKQHPLTSGYLDAQRSELNGLADAIKSPGKAIDDLKGELNAFPAQFDKSPFMSFWRGIPNFFRDIWHSVTGGTSDAVSSVSSTLSALPGDAGRWFGGLKDNAVSKVGELRDSVTQRASETWNGVSGWFSRLGGNASQWFGDMRDRATERLGNLRDTAAQDASTAWNNISGKFSRLGSDASTWFGDMRTNAGNMLGNLRDNAGQLANSAWNGINGFFSHLGNDANGWFGGLRDNARNLMTNLHDSVLDLAGKAGQGVIDAFNRMKDLAGQAWAALRDLANAPVRWVIDVVYNHGILPLWNKVVDIFGGARPTPLAGGGVLPGYAPGRDTVPAMLSPGEGVLTPEAVKMVGADNVIALNRKASGRLPGSTPSGVAAFAAGGIVDGIAGIAADPVGYIRNLFAGVVGDGARTPGFGALRNAVAGLPGRVVDMAIAKIKDLIHSAMSAVGSFFSAPFTGGGAVRDWIEQALKLTGTPESWAGPLSVLIGRESGGNPNAINRTDSNAAAGHPSQGLMQTIPSTFQAYHQPGTSWNITDPVANIAAGINYIKARYGDILHVQQANPNLPPKGYDTGGLLPAGTSVVRNSTGRPERVLSAQQTDAFDRLVAMLGNGRKFGRDGGVTVNVTQTSGSPAETGRFVALALRTVG